MKPRNPLNFILKQPKDIILFASSEFIGDRQKQEDSFLNFKDECFALADGVGGMPHGDVAAKLAVESAIWGYKLIRQRHTYWQDKKLFIKRIFRSANITVLQKQREAGFSDGLATTLVVLIMGDRIFWLGSVGDTSAFLYRNEILTKLTAPDIDEQGYLTKVLGTDRYGLVPQFITDRSLPEDIMLLVTDGVTNFVSQEQMVTILEKSGQTQRSIQEATDTLTKVAKENGSSDNMTACVVKRVQNTNI